MVFFFQIVIDFNFYGVNEISKTKKKQKTKRHQLRKKTPLQQRATTSILAARRPDNVTDVRRNILGIFYRRFILLEYPKPNTR